MPSFEGRLHRAGESLGRQRGFTLVELLVTASLMVVVLLAVAAIADSTQSASTRDRARANTLAAGEAGLARMAYELRQACYIVPPGATPSSGICGRSGVVPAATLCSNPAFCVDFIKLTRTCIQRTTSATCPGVTSPCGSPPCVTRSTQRVRYDCSVVDPANNGTTECVRFQGGACAATAAAGSPSSDCAAPGRSVAPCTGAALASDPPLIRSLLNYNTGSALDCSSTVRPVFTYCLASDNYTAGTNGGLACSGTPATTGLAAMRLSVYLARRGERRSGLLNGMLLQDGVSLRNIALESGP